MAMFPVIKIIKNISVEKKRMCRMQTRQWEFILKFIYLHITIGAFLGRQEPLQMHWERERAVH